MPKNIGYGKNSSAKLRSLGATPADKSLLRKPAKGKATEAMVKEAEKGASRLMKKAKKK